MASTQVILASAEDGGREKGREEYNAFIRPDGTWIRQYLFPGRRPGHIQSNSDNSLVVGDGAWLVGEMVPRDDGPSVRIV